jgi:SAM-dependent methyltransferase
MSSAIGSEPHLTRAEIEQAMAGVVARHGPWTAHNVHLGHGVFTLGADQPYLKLQRLLQVAADVCERPLASLRVLDLACLEGGFAIEFARHGATVLGIEGREANLAKGQLAKDVLRLDRLTFELGDVRHLSRQRHGEFDVVLCAGILYHLDAPDVFAFVEQIAEVCRRLTIVDTSVSIRAAESRSYKGRTYHGRTFPEHEGAKSRSEWTLDLWDSLDNASSFWLTRPSLLNLLKEAGFSSVMEVLNPALPGQLGDRTVLAAIKSTRQTIHAAPSTNDLPFPDWAEHEKVRYDAMQRPTYQLEKRLTHLVPLGLRQRAKRILQRAGFRKASGSPWEWPVPWKERR